jgi:predicted secreted hydrolase
MHRVRWLAVIVLVCAGLPRFAVQAQEQDPPAGIASAVLTFPRDHRMHQDDPLMNRHYIEWLYFTGVLQDEVSGATWGYEITLWQAVIPILRKNQPLFAYDVALSDVQHSRHIVYRVVPAQLKPARLGEISQQGDTWIYEHPGGLTIRHQETQDVWHLAFTGDPAGANAGQPPIQIAVDLVNDQSDYYTHLPGGLSPLGVCAANPETLDGYTYYYSHPALTTTATVTIGQQTVVLRGDTWFDHQWGNFNYCSLKWNWFSLRLDDGGYLMIFQSCDRWGDPLPGLYGLSYIDPVSGQRQFWTGSDSATLTPVRTWTDPATGIAFPLAWEITTPVGTFGIEPAFDGQMMPPLPKPYWEGVIVVREGGIDGDRIGDGYLEVAR